MTRFLTVLLSFLASTALAQNLVPNSSFEEVLAPMCSFIVPGENISQYINDWRAPTGGTADYWTTTPTAIGCSRNIKNANLIPHTGGTCIGIYVSAVNLNNLNNAANVRAYREYAQVRLKQPLVKGKVYYAEFYTSLWERSSLASNNLGMLFTTTPVERKEDILSRGGIMAYRPQINYTDPLITNGRWYKVSGCFVADAAHEYLTIGNFYSETATTFRVAQRTINGDPYYFIDDVFVGDPESALPAISLGRDTVLCGQQSISYRFPTVPGVTYRWQDGTTAPTYTVNQTGQYVIRATTATGQCELLDTVQVRVEPVVRLAADTVFCADEPITIKPLDPTITNLEWNTGSREPTVQVSQSGVYWVRRLSDRCPSADTLVARAVGCPGAVPNVFTPNGDGINDTFRIPGLADQPWHMTILNRWGNVVYEANPYRNDWDGGSAPSGVYYFRLNTALLKRNYTGTITIYRE